MTILVVGASGATGKHLVNHLLEMGHTVKVVVRSPENLPQPWKKHDRIAIIHASVLEIPKAEMADHLSDCQAVASCLGHNLTWKGLYGKPRKLVTDAVKLLCHAINLNAPGEPIRLVLMNTAGNRNRDLDEPVSIMQRIIIFLLRLLLPPHPDNEQAADYLRETIGQNHPAVTWVVVRPDTLTDADHVSGYNLHPSPVRSAIFNPGKTSRINVGHFMAQLINDDDLWTQWKGQMPVIYNDEA
jgi:nucleoside-diphosphate-sugar epimerase